MAVTAQDVKKLRDETGAPMGECKSALEEAGGDFERARQILREKGAAAATKRAGRGTSEGVAFVVANADNTKVGGVVVECETDFVSKNAEFIAMVQEIAGAFVETDPGSDPLAVKVGDKTVKDLLDEAVGRIRENIKLTRSLHLSNPDGIGVYVHHDRKHAAAVELVGASDKNLEAGKNVAMQVVALKPSFLKKEDIPADVIEAEFETQKKRALEEGKPENIAENIARGRVNKEFFSEAVLLEQPFYLDNKKTVGAYVSEATGGKATVKSFNYLFVGGTEGTDED